MHNEHALHAQHLHSLEMSFELSVFCLMEPSVVVWYNSNKQTIPTLRNPGG